MAIQQISYLKSKFEKGDFPDQNDFHDLIDSSYNYSLSVLPEFFSLLQPLTGNWQETYSLVQANSGENWSYQGLDLRALSGNWQHTYTTVKNASGIWEDSYKIGTDYQAFSANYATKEYTNSTFIPNSGGTISNSLNVTKQLLSGGQDLFNIFQAKPNDFQKLSYNSSTESLTITPGNSVSLSALASYVLLRFSHSQIDPVANTNYYFGQFSNLPPITYNSLSRQVQSIVKGTATEAVLYTSFLSSGEPYSESAAFYLVNKTKGNIQSLISSNVKISNNVVEFVNQTLRTGSTPAGWPAPTQVSFITTEGGYAYFSDATSILESPAFNGAPYAKITVKFNVAKFGSGTDGPIGVEYSLNGGSTWTFAGPSPTPIDDVYEQAEIDITETSNNMKIRLRRNLSPFSGKRVRDLTFTGIGGDGAGVGRNVLTPPLAIDKDDILEIKWATPNWTSNPTEVLTNIDILVKI